MALRWGPRARARADAAARRRPAASPRPPRACARVGARRVQLSGRFLLLGLAFLQGSQNERERRDKDRDANEDHETQRPGLAQQDDGHDDVARDCAGETCGHVIQPTQAHGVRGDRRDHLAGGHAAGKRLAGVGRLVPDQLHAPKGGAQPVLDGEPVAHHPGKRADGTQRDEYAAPGQQGPSVVGDDAEIDRLADRRWEECLADHPDDTEEHPAQQGAPLTPRDPAKEPHGRTKVRGSGIRIGHSLHRTSHGMGEVVANQTINGG